MFKSFLRNKDKSADEVMAAVQRGNRYCVEDPMLGRLVSDQAAGMYELIKYCHKVGYEKDDWEDINQLMGFLLFRLAEDAADGESG